MEIKAVWYWNKNDLSPEIYPCLHRKLIYDKEPRVNIREKISSMNDIGKTGQPLEK